VKIAQSVLKNRRTVVYSGNSLGKTHAAGGIVQWFFDCYSPSITLTTAPSWSSIHDLLWAEVKNQRKSGAPGRLLDLILIAGPMHYAKGHNADSKSGYQGRHEARQLLLLDEGSGIPPYIWEATSAMMTSPDCRLLVLGNPIETSGEYYDVRNNPNYTRIRLSCLDHPNILAALAGQPTPYPAAVSLVWVEEMLRDHAETTRFPDADSIEWPPGSGIWYNPDDVFRPRVLGLFPKQASQSVWDEKWLDDARSRELMWTKDDQPEIGCDVARFGDDKTTIWDRIGPCVLGCDAYGKRDTMETVGWLVDHAEKLGKKFDVDAKQIRIKVDDSVMGGGVTDRLRELEFRAIAVIAGENAIESDKYYRTYSELWFLARNVAKDGKLDLTRLDDESFRKLQTDLLAPHYKMQSDRLLRIESKDEVKKRIGRSPDYGDGFNLAFYPGRSVLLGFA